MPTRTRAQPGARSGASTPRPRIQACRTRTNDAGVLNAPFCAITERHLDDRWGSGPPAGSRTTLLVCIVKIAHDFDATIGPLTASNMDVGTVMGRAGALRWLAIGALATSGLTVPLASASAASLPDLSITRHAPASGYLTVPYIEKIRVTNRGTAPTTGVTVDYAPGTPIVSGGSPSVTCGAIIKGHSGRGGGYRRVGWRCSRTVTGGLAPGASVTVAVKVLPTHIGTLIETFAAAPSPNVGQIGLVSHGATGSVAISLPPIPDAPTAVHAVQVGDDFHVDWTPDPATAAMITSSTVTATPEGSSAPTLTATAQGTVTNVLIGPLQPETSYQITVTNTDSGGTGPASDPLTVATPTSTVPPSVPSGLTLRWNTANQFIAYWTAAVPGDSPVDAYEVKASAYDADPPVPGPFTQSVDGGARNAVFMVDQTFDWSVRVRAHNAAGWGPWSAAVVLGGL